MPELTPDTTAQPSPDPTLTEISRRRVLRVAAVSGAGAALVVACGGDDTSTDASDQGSGGSTSTPDDTSSSAAESTDDAGGGGGGGLVATADVPVKGGVVLDDKKIVVTQPASGEFKAFTAVCTHQQCTVASVEGNTITCPCHGSTYSAVDGSVKGGPATNPLRAIPVAVEGDQVVKA